MFSKILRSTFVLSMLLMVAACTSRSPDLPIPKLLSMVVSCIPQGPISAGQTSQCSISQCTYEVINADGTVGQTVLQCPADPSWTTSPGSVGSINNNGTLTGVGAGIVTVTATVDGGSGSTTVAVNAACVNTFTISPATAHVVAGLTQAYTATATFSDGHTGDVTGQTTWTSSNTNVVTIGSDGIAHAVSAGSATITGSFTPQSRCSGTGAMTSNPGTLTVDPAQVLPQPNGLCIEPVNGATTLFNGCRADTGVCAVHTPVNLTVAQQAQFRLRARFDNGQECNVTVDQNTTWSSSDVAVATVGTGSPNAGLATGVAPGSANAQATYKTIVAAPYAIVVAPNRVLGNNSLRISAKPYTVTETPRKFACVGATDIVGALADSSQIQGRLKLFAGARFCASNNRNLAGTCTFVAADALSDVTNDDGLPPGNRIVWSQASSYWDGNTCVSTLPALPLGQGPSGLVGDQLTPPARYALGDRRPGENGVVVGAGDVRVGFTCIVAQYTNPTLPTNKVSDGMTVLVLPVTNDVILGPSSANDATHLCDAVEPLFQLAASPNGGNGALTQLLSAVTEIVNPIAQSVADGTEPGNAGPLPVTMLVNQVLVALSDNATAQIFAAGLGTAVGTVDTGVYSPALCGLGALLTAITTQDPAAVAAAQACLP